MMTTYNPESRIMDTCLEKFRKCLMRDQNTSMETHLFRLISLTISILCLFLILPANLIQDLSPYMNLGIFIYGLVAAYLYRCSCHGRHFILPYALNGHEQMRVLVVDDHPEARVVLSNLLKAMRVGSGLTHMGIETAESGEQALHMMPVAEEAGKPYELLLLDWVMPGLVAMSAHALAEERTNCQSMGMQDHISKPIDPEALFAVLASYYVRKPETTSPPFTTSSVMYNEFEALLREGNFKAIDLWNSGKYGLTRLFDGQSSSQISGALANFDFEEAVTIARNAFRTMPQLFQENAKEPAP